MRRILLLATFVALAMFCNSCSVMVGGQSIIRIPDFTSSTWVEFDGVADPCVKPLSKVSENLGSGAPATLWSGRGTFYLHPAGNVINATYTYAVAGGGRGREDGRSKSIVGPNWKFEVPNTGSNADITLTVTVNYQGRTQPWVGEYDIYNQNLRELCGGRR